MPGRYFGCFSFQDSLPNFSAAKAVLIYQGLAADAVAYPRAGGSAQTRAQRITLADFVADRATERAANQAFGRTSIIAWISAGHLRVTRL